MTEEVSSTMPLSNTERNLVDEYMRRVDSALGSVTPSERARKLALIKNGVLRQVQEMQSAEGVANPVAKAIERMGPPERFAPPTERTDEAPSSSPQSAADEDRVWLGVCAAVADAFNLPVFTVRAIMILLGITGPVALCVYLAAFFLFVYGKPGAPQIVWTQMARLTLTTVTIAVALFALGRGILWGLDQLHGALLPMLADPEPQWRWYAYSDLTYLIRTLLVAGPLAVLAGMPLARDWEKTVYKFAQAALAVYGAVISIGFGYLIVGYILRGVQFMST